MVSVGLFVKLEAKAGKEAALEAFLKQGLRLAIAETTTPLWCALRLGPSTFAIFDAFANDEDRRAHLRGPIARALMEHAPELLEQPPAIEEVDVLGVKADLK